ncbi:MAG: hypothetical protein VYC09_04670 [Verrucomicrobiota bacterium]|nr:hypothetical protein [Verrucomicrobiota bacterium]
MFVSNKRLSESMPSNKQQKHKTMAFTLVAIFLIALIMGPGPGSLMINSPGSEPKFWFGMPALYVWVVLWFFVEAAVILIAARFLWGKRQENE